MTTRARDRAIRIAEVEPFFTVEEPVGTFAFGAATVNDLTLVHVRVRVEDRRGRSATGWGAVFLSHPWAFPGDSSKGAAKDQLMRQILVAQGQWLMSSSRWGHPLDHFLAIQPELDSIALTIASSAGMVEPVPQLVNLVSLSPIDAAIHDAYGKIHNANSYDVLGPDDVEWDLSQVLGPAYAGRYLPEFLRSQPVSRLTISHTVGAADALTVGDGPTHTMPSLEEWIRQDGVHSFKVKLKGQDLAWDIARLVNVNRVARSVHPDVTPHIFADLNEQAPSVAYIHALLQAVEADADTWAALDALEQPLSRHLTAGAPSLASVSKRIPVVLDEGLTSLETIDRAVDLGWSGIALKTCKTQSLMLLALAQARHQGMHVSVQDLTNPGIALLQSAGLAARMQQTRPMEFNSRQYYPQSSAPEASVFPETFQMKQGTIATEDLVGVGLGYQVERIPRSIFR